MQFFAKKKHSFFFQKMADFKQLIWSGKSGTLTDEYRLLSFILRYTPFWLNYTFNKSFINYFFAQGMGKRLVLLIKYILGSLKNAKRKKMKEERSEIQ